MFRSKHNRSPQELTKALVTNLEALRQITDQGGSSSAITKPQEKVRDDVCKLISQLKAIALTSGNDAAPDALRQETTAALSSECCQDDRFMENLLLALPHLDFEAKKDASQLLVALIRREIGNRQPVADALVHRPHLVLHLVKCYESPDIALNTGHILRECIRTEDIAKQVLFSRSEEVYRFFKYVESSTFDVSSDAFLTFKDLLTRHKMIACQFIERNYDRFFSEYERLLNSENYVTRRQALKLLGELLLDRHNFSIMTKYISNQDNLKLMMNLLKEKSRNIQYEAFHVFKVFVANPNKPRPIQEILLRNQDRLIDFLTKFQTDRTDDEQFNDEKAYLIKQIREMQPLPS